jgi:hypothetical protein
MVLSLIDDEVRDGGEALGSRKFKDCLWLVR